MRLKIILQLIFLFLPVVTQSQSVSSAVMNQYVKDMVYDSLLSSIIISIPATDTINGNSIGFVNPDLAILTAVVPVGGAPNPVALTENGQFLYFGSDSTGTIRKMDLFSQSIVQTIQLHQNNNGQAYAKKIACQPGNDSVIAVTGDFNLTTATPAAAIFSNGIKLPDTINSINFNIDVIQFQTPAILYGYNNHTTNHEFTTNDVGPNGITVSSSIGTAFTIVTGYEFTLNGNLALGDDGKTVNLSQSPPVPGGSCMLLPNLGFNTKRACFDPYLDLLCIARWVYQLGSDSIYIERFHRSNFLPYDVLKVPGFGGQVRKIITWGGPGKYAISLTNGHLIIVNAAPTGLNHFDEERISVSPNPGNGVYNIRLDKFRELNNVILEVYDNNGKNIRNFTLTEAETILDISEFSSGVYQLKIITVEKSFSCKIIKS